MTEFDEMRYCNKCLKNTIHLCSGSGNKSSCYKCGTGNKKTQELTLKELNLVNDLMDLILEHTNIIDCCEKCSTEATVDLNEQKELQLKLIKLIKKGSD